MRINVSKVALTLTLGFSLQAFCTQETPQDHLEQASHAYRPPSSAGGLCFGATFEESQAYKDFYEALKGQKPDATHDECVDAFFELLEKDAPLERFCTDENSFSRDSLHNPRLVNALTRHLGCEGKRTGLRALGLPDFVWDTFLKNDAFHAAFKKSPVSELTCYGTGPVEKLVGISGVKQLHLVWDSPIAFGTVHAKGVAAFPNLEVLTLGGRIFFDRVSSLATPVSQILADYLKETKTLKALELSGLNRVVLNASCMFGTISLSDRYTAFPNAPRDVSNYFMPAQFMHLYEAILQNTSLTFLDLSTSAVHDKDASSVACQITELITHVNGNRAPDTKDAFVTRLVKELTQEGA